LTIQGVVGNNVGVLRCGERSDHDVFEEAMRARMLPTNADGTAWFA